MKEVKDPEIRLFGRKIVLPERGGGGESSAESCGSGGGGVECDRDLDSSGVVEEGGDDGNRIHQEEVQVLELCNSVEESLNPTKSDSDENPKSSSTVEGGMSDNQGKAETEQIDAANGQQKALKKPDKVLPCPRCNSMDTKFCYYNNYNVNQPRYFCKSCQRYWTEGGTMRNVPVGAGRRKNKTPTSHCRHITVSDALQPARIDAVNGLHHPAFKPNGATHVNRNRHPEVDHGDDCSIASSVITTSSSADGSKIRALQSMNVFPSPFPALPGAPLPVPWNSALAMPAIYPIPFCPPPYWSCSLPNAWNAAWPSFQEPTTANPSSSLGKHARNGELLKTTCSASKENLGNSIVIPKTLRIDDPEEAAKSSIWETLGIKYDSSSREGLFKALQPKGGRKKPPISPSPAFQANPAALSRSISFQEQA